MFDSGEFLKFAEKCRLMTDGQVAYRTAVSRAYYAVYHRAHEHGTERGVSFTRGPEAHGQVMRELRYYNHGWGQDLDGLRELRNRSDYDLLASENQIIDDAQSAIEDAIALMKHLEMSIRQMRKSSK